MKVGFSGTGNMATAIVVGLINNKILKPSDVHVFSPTASKKQDKLFSQFHWHDSNKSMAEAVDVLVFGFKPYTMPDVAGELNHVPKLPLLVSMLAGVTTESIEKNMPNQSAAIIRTMPNTPSAIGQGMTGLYANSKVTQEQKASVENVFKSIGDILWLSDENKFHALTAVSGSGPAYFFQFTAHLINAGVKAGLNTEEASQLALQTAKGAALLMQGNETPDELRQKVTSPNGTTHAAITHFQQAGLDKIVEGAVNAAANRSKELSS